MKKLLYLLYVFILALLLTGCSNAGKDQTVHPGDTVTLDGTKSKGKIERYEWKQISGESVTLANQNSATATFVAPNMTTSTVLTFRLNVLEKIYGRNIRTVDYVYITVTPVEPENIPPTAHISVSQSSIYTGESVDFSGSTSTDSDGDIVSYLWKDANRTTIGTSENFTYLFDHIGEYSITLIVTDDKGATNETNTTITVAQEADTTKPVITLHGNAEVNLTVGDNYIDAGATAEDDRDGNLTADINTTNPVNTQVAGTYTITYNVSDVAGNAADEVMRTVHIVEAEGNNSYVYGSEGTYMNEVQIEETDDYIVYYPKNHVVGAPLVLFAGYYKATKMDDGRYRNEGAMRYLASLGCCVIGNKRIPASWTNAEDFLDVFTTVELPIPNGVNRDKFAIVGHSTGGMASYYMMQEFKKKGYGAEKSFIINIHGWTASSMNKDQLEALNVDSLILAYGGDEGIADEVGNVNQDPRVLLTISYLLPNDSKKAFIVLETKNHYYHWGEYAEADERQYGPLKDKKDFLKPVDAMVKYEFFNESGKYNNANEILFAPYIATIARVKNATLEYLDGRTSLEVYGDYSCEKARNYGVDYCSDYLGNNDSYIYPPDTKLTEVGVEDLSRPEKTAFEDISKASVIDPAFGTTITRIHHDGARFQYPKSPFWNADMTYLYLGYRLFDANTLVESPITKDLNVDEAFAKLKSPVSAFRWSHIEPKVFYILQGANRADHNYTFTKNTIVGNEVEPKEIFNFQKYQFEKIQLGNGESHIDRFDKYVVFMAKKPNNNQMFVLLCNIQKPNEECKIEELEDSIWATVHVDDDNDGVYSTRSLFDWIDISPNGDHIIVNKTVNAIDYIDKEVKSVETAIYMYDLNFTNKQKIANTGGHGDLGLGANGDQVYVQFEWLAGHYGVFSYNLDAPEGQRETKVLSSTYGGGHISCQNFKRPGWCYLSTNYNGGEYNEVFALKLDGNETVNRFVKARSTVGPYAGVSPDGKRVVYLSNWDEDNKSIYNIYHAGLKK